MYNSTFVNGGVQIKAGERTGGINFEQGAEGSFYNNVFINCRVGYRVVNNPVADTANLSYGNNYIMDKEGTVLMVREHRTIAAIVRALGVRDFNLTWYDNDYDSIWIVTITKGIATISNDKEGLVPASNCSY